MGTTSTKATPTTDLAQKIREQLVSSVQQGQQQTVDAAKTWVKTLFVLPVPDLPKSLASPPCLAWKPQRSTPSTLWIELLIVLRRLRLGSWTSELEES